MNSMNQSTIRRLLVVAVALSCFVLLPSAPAVNPPPDGGYPGGNTAEGEEALFKLKTTAAAVDNTAIGSHALFSTTTGVDNTAVGSFALNANTNGRNNTATGSGSLIFNTSGR